MFCNGLNIMSSCIRIQFTVVQLKMEWKHTTIIIYFTTLLNSFPVTFSTGNYMQSHQPSQSIWALYTVIAPIFAHHLLSNTIKINNTLEYSRTLIQSWNDCEHTDSSCFHLLASRITLPFYPWCIIVMLNGWTTHVERDNIMCRIGESGGAHKHCSFLAIPLHFRCKTDY